MLRSVEIISLISIFGFLGSFMYLRPNTKAKLINDKILLRKLLEGFELDIPDELKELEGKVAKSITNQ